VRRGLRRLGYDVQRYRGEGESYETRRGRIMRLHEVDLVLDVGANVGQYAIGLRRLGYRGRIVSFEPLQAAFAQLKARAAGDPSWQCVKTALGESCGEAVIHVAGNSVSSSLLPMADLHAEMFPESTYVGDEDVPIAPLQTVAADFLTGDERILLKMDVQGYELAVLRGSEGLLDAVSVIEAEMSTRELYEGQPLWWEIVQFLADREYQLSIAHELIVDADTGCLVQLDGVFVRPSVA
jgi:FkbM family methyltransferase